MPASGGSGTALDEIRKDLAAIRDCLMSSGLAEVRETALRLQSIVDRFRSWTSEGPVTRESVEEIRTALAALRPLFENANALHAGWFNLVDVSGGEQYGRNGRRVDNGGTGTEKRE
jgi:hypothetical protein